MLKNSEHLRTYEFKNFSHNFVKSESIGVHMWSLQCSLLDELWFMFLIHKRNQYNYTSMSIIIPIAQMVSRGKEINIKIEFIEW